MIPKYRAYDKETKKVYPVTDLDFSRDGQNLLGVAVRMEPAFIPMLQAEQVVLMQSTGMFDRKGAEIYVGDVLEIRNTKRFIREGNITCFSEVKVSEGHVYVWTQPIVKGRKIRYGALQLRSGLSKYIDMQGVATSDVKVIGNIYENPDLVED